MTTPRENGSTCGFCNSRDITETGPGKRECLECEALAFNFGFGTEDGDKWEWFEANRSNVTDEQSKDARFIEVPS